MYTEFLGNPTGNIFVAASGDLEILLNHRVTTWHVSHTSIESSMNLSLMETALRNTVQKDYFVDPSQEGT